MTTIPFPNESGSWNKVMLAGKELPGIAHVSIDWDVEINVHKAKGKSGATTTEQGVDPAKIDIELMITTKDQLNEWFSQFQDLWHLKGKGGAVPILHPKTLGYRIKSVILKSLKDDSGKEGEGDRYRVRIECLQFLAPSATGSKTTKKLDPRRQVLGEDLPNAPRPSVTNTNP